MLSNFGWELSYTLKNSLNLKNLKNIWDIIITPPPQKNLDFPRVPILIILIIALSYLWTNSKESSFFQNLSP